VALAPEPEEAGRLRFLPAEALVDGMLLSLVDRASQRECTPPFRMSRFSLRPGVSSPLDQHEAQELWFVAAGRGCLTRGGTHRIELTAGDIIELGARLTHTLCNTGSDELVVFSVWWS
jgi:mannose-6-phosphate isomerase-like protein (cupin superfamily)